MTVIRTATVDDLSALVAIENACFSDPWSEALIAGSINTYNYSFLVCEVDSKIAGFAIFLSSFDAELLDIAVLPEYRGRGIGSMLLEHFFDTCNKDTFLEVRRSNNSAIALYKKFGFEEIGIRKNYYANPTEDAIVMTKTSERDN